MDLRGIASRSWPGEHPPGLPWHDESFSRRMLGEHLDQTHDLASRRMFVVERHVQALDRIAGPGGAVLDLACGPGLYTAALSRLGHRCLGVDIAPAAVAYARANSPAGCSYLLGDVGTADLGTGHAMAMMLFGQLDTFSPGDATRIIRRAAAALGPSGTLVVEIHKPDHVIQEGGAPPTWWTADHGLFSDEPHLVLQEHRLGDRLEFADTRHLVVDLATGSVTEHIHRTHAVGTEEWTGRLMAAGFSEIADHGPFTDEPVDRAFTVLVARRAH